MSTFYECPRTVAADGAGVHERRRGGGPAIGGPVAFHVTFHGRPARVRIAAGASGNAAGIHRLTAAD